MGKSGHKAGIQFYKLDLFHCYTKNILGKLYKGTGIRTAGSSGQKCRLQIFTEQLSNAIEPQVHTLCLIANQCLLAKDRHDPSPLHIFSTLFCVPGADLEADINLSLFGFVLGSATKGRSPQVRGPRGRRTGVCISTKLLCLAGSLNTKLLPGSPGSSELPALGSANCLPLRLQTGRGQQTFLGKIS